MNRPRSLSSILLQTIRTQWGECMHSNRLLYVFSAAFTIHQTGMCIETFHGLSITFCVTCKVTVLPMKLSADRLAAKSWIYPLNRPKRDYQYNIVKSCLLENTLVALPTGLGKTFIAGVVMLNCA